MIFVRQLLSKDERAIELRSFCETVSDYTPRHERSLILERLTHLVLRIKLDKEQETLTVNDATVDLKFPSNPTSEVAAEASTIERRVQVLRSEVSCFVCSPAGSITQLLPIGSLPSTVDRPTRRPCHLSRCACLSRPQLVASGHCLGMFVLC
jgi:hypothetical protein